MKNVSFPKNCRHLLDPKKLSQNLHRNNMEQEIKTAIHSKQKTNG